jgi:hypothetical protein
LGDFFMHEWRSGYGAVGLLAVLGVVAWLAVSCETAEGLAGLSLNQSDVSMGRDVEQLRFTVVGGISSNSTLALPLEWRVSNASFGSITGASGLSATYVRNSRSGQNTVIVRDQYGNEGYATVNQLSSAGYAIELTVTVDGSVTTIIPAGQNTAEITVSGEGTQAPYSWSVTSGNGAIVSGQGGSTVVFRSNGVGSSAVQVKDGNGVVAATSVTQADEEDSGSSDGGDSGSGDTGGGDSGPGSP